MAAAVLNLRTQVCQ